jgi:hypothetical protein
MKYEFRSIIRPAARAGFRSALKDGAGILNHLFGSQTSNVANAVSQSSGLDTNGSMKMLQMLAPVLMGMLGQQKKQNNLDAKGLGNLTSMLASNFGSEAGASGIMDVVTNLLDANKDGNVMDDIMGIVGKFFGGNK